MLYNAMRKYGNDNFIWNELEYCKENELAERETFWIKYFDSYHNGYNSTTGGEYRKEVSLESRRKMCEGHKGQKSWNKGKKLPPLPQSQRNKIKSFCQKYKGQNRLNQKTRKPIRCIETGIEYESIRDCANKTGIKRASISRQLRGIYHSAGGYWNNGVHFKNANA